jgi:FAD-dependent urate hydroxylase
MWQSFISGLVVDASDEATERITGYPIFDIPTQPVWHKERATLVGDALHAVSPTAGQDASLAMEDAIVLAQCLRDIPDQESALAAYECRRRDRVERVVQYGHSLGSWRAMSNPVQLWIWEQLMPLFLKCSANPSALDWIYTYKVDWGATVTDEQLSLPPRPSDGEGGLAAR